MTTMLRLNAFNRPLTVQRVYASTHVEHGPKTVKIGKNEYPADTIENIKMLNDLGRRGIYSIKYTPRFLLIGEDRKKALFLHRWFYDASTVGIGTSFFGTPIRQKYGQKMLFPRAFEKYPSANRPLSWMYPYAYIFSFLVLSAIGIVYNIVIPEEYRLKHKHKDVYDALDHGDYEYIKEKGLSPFWHPCIVAAKRQLGRSEKTV